MLNIYVFHNYYNTTIGYVWTAQGNLWQEIANIPNWDRDPGGNYNHLAIPDHMRWKAEAILSGDYDCVWIVGAPEVSGTGNNPFHQ